MKRICRQAAAILAAVCIFASGACALSAQRAAVLDADTGALLFEQDAQSPGLIASTTKIMTGLLVCERCALEEQVRVPAEAVGVEGSSIYLERGELVTVEELLYGLMLHSGNDAAVALAIHVGGSVESFVQLMNRRAEELELRQTHFSNPNGLDAPEHYASAADLARLAAAALKNETFRRIVGTKSIQIGTRSFTNHNKLLWRYDGAIGVKTGYTRAAGRILVSAAQRFGRTVVAVTMNAPDDWRDHAALLDAAFSAYREVTLVAQDAPLAQVPVLTGGTAQARAAAPFCIGLRAGESATLRVLTPQLLWEQPQAGAPAGCAEVLLDGETVGAVALYWGVET